MWFGTAAPSRSFVAEINRRVKSRTIKSTPTLRAPSLRRHAPRDEEMELSAGPAQQTPDFISDSATISARSFAMKKNVRRAIEVGFIIFLFYSNLLMGEFERSGMGQKRGVAWALGDVFTTGNFAIAVIAALVGYSLLEFLRKRF